MWSGYSLAHSRIFALIAHDTEGRKKFEGAKTQQVKRSDDIALRGVVIPPCAIVVHGVEHSLKAIGVDGTGVRGVGVLSLDSDSDEEPSAANAGSSPKP